VEFKMGDVVVLKSGGPKMTIEKIGPRNSNNGEIVANCVWFENNQTKEDKFNLVSLMLAPEK
jgi:uncharacterized protein YodC (DUF2158 family)